MNGRIERDEEREARIHDEAIVDAYGPEEQVMGWYYYLDDKLHFPFTARCIVEREISPLNVDETVTATGMISADDCPGGMFVEIEWQGRRMGAPLAQLEAVDADEETEEAIGDWHYWVGRGYQLF